MATINPTITRVGDGDVLKVVWEGIAAGDTCAALSEKYAQWADRCVEIVGTFDGATITLQGSNGGSTYYTLNDPTGTDISAASAKLFQVLENPLFTKPAISAGTTVDVDVIMIMRRAQPFRT